MKRIKGGGVTSPAGFKANGIWCGLKRSGRPDLALICCGQPIPAAAVFTKNSIKAAPLILSQKHLQNKKAQAIIVNSGNANCFTGKAGLISAQRTADVVAGLLSCRPQDIIVASTGIIGKPLPFDKISQGIPSLVKGLSTEKGHRAAKAILTTDIMLKEIAVEFNLSGKKVTIGACAKGSGMIEPHMATMLAFITTDAAITPAMLQLALKKATDKTFNRITVDGCMSTNDMVTLMASGLAGNRTITQQGKDFQLFLAGLELVCLELAKKIILDGEGATKFITVTVKKAQREEQALKIAKAIANSVLVKTAAFGNNPNWGRVAAAVGSLGYKINEKNLKIKFSSFANKEIDIIVEVNLGHHEATVFTSDLSYDYVKINSEYN